MMLSFDGREEADLSLALRARLAGFYNPAFPIVGLLIRSHLSPDSLLRLLGC
jgi:hypothetical protein